MLPSELPDPQAELGIPSLGFYAPCIYPYIIVPGAFVVCPSLRDGELLEGKYLKVDS